MPLPPPRAFPGWRMVWALSMSALCGYGVLYYSFAVFVTPMEQELGWNRAQTSGAFALSSLMTGLVAPLLGRVLDRWGAREVVPLGAVLGALLLLAWSQTSSLGTLYAVWILLGACAAATLYDPAFTVIAVWFRQQRARALLILTLVGGLATSVFISLDTLLLEQLGWRAAVRVLAVILALSSLPVLFTVRRRPEDGGWLPDGAGEPPGVRHRAGQELGVGTLEGLSPVSSGERSSGSPVLPLLRSPVFWSVALAFGLARAPFAFFASQLVPLLLERDFSRATAAAAGGAIGLMQLVGRLVLAPLMTRLPLVTLTLAMFGLHALGIGVLLASGEAALIAFVLLYGSTNGALTLARAALIAERFPPEIYGRVNGAVSLVVALFGAATPFGAGVLHSSSGDYHVALLLLLGCMALAGAALLGSRR